MKLLRVLEMTTLFRHSINRGLKKQFKSSDSQEWQAVSSRSREYFITTVDVPTL
jgi:hypothetical protein